MILRMVDAAWAVVGMVSSPFFFFFFFFGILFGKGSLSGELRGVMSSLMGGIGIDASQYWYSTYLM